MGRIPANPVVGTSITFNAGTRGIRLADGTNYRKVFPELPKDSLLKPVSGVLASRQAPR